MTKKLFAIVFLLACQATQAMEQNGKRSPQNDKAEQLAAGFHKQQHTHFKGGRRLFLGDDEEDAPVLGLKPGQQVQKNKRAQNANARRKAQFETQRQRNGLAAKKAGDVNSDDENYQDGYTDEDDN